MNFTIPGLEGGYFGGKGSSGVPQQIINIIPPHETLIIPFLGHCAITRCIKPAKKTLLIEKDRIVFLYWINNFTSAHIVDGDYKWNDFSVSCGSHFPNLQIYNKCGIEFLENLNPYFERFNPNESKVYRKCVVYCDPPYLLETRTSGPRYKHEMTVEDHERFLNAVTKIDAPVLVSHYKNDMYDSHLKGWNTISFMSQLRTGKQRRETVYFNYEKPTELHDYSYFGNNYRQRESYKKAATNMLAKFERMKPLERNFILNELQKSGVISRV
ncbi:MAG: DNA adenine methylase [Aequorivita sp.]|nr:DNA adenine methylase [Aequorivita sp.]